MGSSLMVIIGESEEHLGNCIPPLLGPSCYVARGSGAKRKMDILARIESDPPSMIYVPQIENGLPYWEVMSLYWNIKEKREEMRSVITPFSLYFLDHVDGEDLFILEKDILTPIFLHPVYLNWKGYSVSFGAMYLDYYGERR